MAYSKQNFQNGQILNAANLEAMENGIIAGQGAHNLLDNSDFRNPVNSRGIYDTTESENLRETIDRWISYLTSIDVNQTGMLLSGQFGSGYNTIYQYVPLTPDGRIYTAALYYADGTVKCASGDFLTRAGGVGEEYGVLLEKDSDGKPYVQLYTYDGKRIIGAALYEGSYTADTLPSYVPKGKHVEMLNCGVPLAPHNLLDNSDFRNPVNQRGQTSYSINGNEYTIDRWKTQYGTGLTIENGYINIIGAWQIYQILKNPKDGVYTFAAEIRVNSIGDNQPNIYISDGTECLLDAPIGQWKTYILQYDLSSIESDNISFSLCSRGGNNSNASISARWAAMYKGSYDTSTLPAYQPKGYAAELAECQRYYQVIPYDLSIYNVATDSDYPSRYPILFPQRMRITPTATLNESWSSNTKTATTSYASDKALCFTVSANSTSYTEWHGSITLSADL